MSADQRRSPRKPDPAIDALVGLRIAARRQALGWSQAALAELLGISFQQVQKYETGVNRVSASRLHQIALVLSASVADFFPEGGEIRLAPQPRLLESPEGRRLAVAFPNIPSVAARRALARIAEALVPS